MSSSMFQGSFSDGIATKQTTWNSIFCRQGPFNGMGFPNILSSPAQFPSPASLNTLPGHFQIMLSGETLQFLCVLCGVNGKYCTTFKSEMANQIVFKS